MKKLIYVCLLLIGFSINSYAQKETSWWHFGFNAGLNFNSLSSATASDATVLTGMPQAITGYVNTYEGCFTVSTYDGELLFASDGITVYNKNGAIMPNGSGLMGDPSATQSGIVIPRPRSLTQYYVVTVPVQGSTAYGIRYSIVDMSLNGGLGDVMSTSKNIVIKSGSVGENIAAVPNDNGEDYWLLHRTAQTFSVYAVTASGISSTPHQTITNTGIIYTGTGNNLGELVVSPDYTKLLAVNWSGQQVISAVFDPATGLISGVQTQTISAVTTTYGAAFSPDGNYIYVTSAYNTPQIYRNTWAGLRSGVASTFLALGPSNIKAGIDGRLYGIRCYRPAAGGAVVSTKDLYVITNPNAGGTVMKYFPDYLIKEAYLGLPSFPAGFIRIKPQSKPFACAAHLRTYGVEIDLSGGNAPVRLEWDFGDGSAVVSQTVSLSQTEYEQQHTYVGAGSYVITVTPYKADGTKAKVISMEANVIYCTLKSNRMTRSELLNSKQQ
ncbi:PKD domain-containing protein [Dysgonomonas macrotermitis]|uniref:PKD domain-containing protein n=1 Tax=Dysgonomonas macrotermitis TaxID=1346286 RepID=A0A1M5AQ00_9BACT|nr:PKD domain-containing protein [Dysgonomonas macrotermitis]SHF32177.1 PKD domain-containing protein [Dysgonomonas macrotermitis]